MIDSLIELVMYTALNKCENVCLLTFVDKLRRFSSFNNVTSLHEYFDQFLYESGRLFVGTRYCNTLYTVIYKRWPTTFNDNFGNWKLEFHIFFKFYWNLILLIDLKRGDKFNSSFFSSLALFHHPCSVSTPGINPKTSSTYHTQFHP